MLTRIRNRDLELARKIHHSLLPAPFEDERLEFAYAFDPMEGVGGDYCHVGYVEGGRLALNVSDVTGHGIPAALMVGRVSSFVQSFLQHSDRPKDLVESLNTFLCARFSGIGVLLTFYAALIDPVKRRMLYSGAGHPPAIIVPRTGPTERLDSQNSILGVAPVAIEESTIPLPRGSLICVFTDGVYEARNGRGASYGIDRLVSKVESMRTLPAAEVVQEVRGEVARHQGGRPHDDSLFLAVRLK